MIELLDQAAVLEQELDPMATLGRNVVDAHPEALHLDRRTLDASFSGHAGSVAWSAAVVSRAACSSCGSAPRR